MAAHKQLAIIILLATVLGLALMIVRRHSFGQATAKPSAQKTATLKEDKVIGISAPSSRRRLSINLVVVPYLQYKAVSDEHIIAREKEYKTALQRNLNHELIRKVHVLTTNARETRHRFSGLANRSKLIVSELRSIDMMRDPFDYISQNLVNKDVVFTNADIYIGGGFDHVDPMVLSQQNIMYALTRQVDKEQKEKCNLTNLCTEKHYIGSHDTFLFHLTEPIPENALKHLEKGLISPGMENVLLWVFQNLLNYCTLNPCTILETFHVHCSHIRNKKGKRVNHRGYSGWAPFTKKLVC